MTQADTTPYLARFGAVARLYSPEGLQRISRSHVCVIGLGGVGSWAVEALARSGVSELTLIDLDDICVGTPIANSTPWTVNLGNRKSMSWPAA
jgi:tRNA A37 threonylcarbamoyladenosine dehydratase